MPKSEKKSIISSVVSKMSHSSGSGSTETVSTGASSSKASGGGGEIADMRAFMESLKQSYEVYYPEKDPYGHIVDKPLPFPQATTELIRWTTTFIDQIAYKYSKEVEDVKHCNGSLEHRIAELEAELEMVLCEKEKLCEENHCLREENEGLCVRIDKLQDEIRALDLKIACLKATIAGLEKDKQALAKKIEVLVQELAIHQKELSIVNGQLSTCQSSLACSQGMWLQAVKAQQKLELEGRETLRRLAAAEAERDGLDARSKLAARELELSLERVAIAREAACEWESRYGDKSEEVAKLLEMWADMDKECKISVHGKAHWSLHHGFPKGLPHHRYRIPEVKCPECDEDGVKEVTKPLPPAKDPPKGKEPAPPPKTLEKAPQAASSADKKELPTPSIPVAAAKKPTVLKKPA